ncbi:MAG: mechanosensitive ion channel [Planctomycetales bacterium]|nr:mechanosensitive ion channel [Planctomycetales bacterium]NIM08625.1 mechanosensitive ion channel [Planctomycetales bacterium]NIN08093.1 mechanosensitive ion channel [Planctomycetales bacterium]NIN77227.1 mechanosensitive ion channel [Planctomycetales bacterium]NIO34406.1 mechanosensitive ion channel [Planctomycetales bacterium]
MSGLGNRLPMTARLLVLLALCQLPELTSSHSLADESHGETAQPAATTGEPQIHRGLLEKCRSPRATLITFLGAYKNGADRSDAIACLDLSQLPPDVRTAAGDTYAMKLKGLLDRMWYVQYEDVSNDPDADEFRLSEYAIELKGADQDDAARIVIDRDQAGLWRFTSETVNAIDPLWNRWRQRPVLAGVTAVRPELFSPLWLEQRFPPHLRQTRFLLADYQWICLLTLVLVGFAVDIIVRFVLGRLTAAWMKIFRNGEQLPAERGLWKPVGLLSQACVWYFGTKLIGLPAFALTILLVALKLFTVVAAVWTAFRLIDLLTAYLARKAEKSTTRFDDLLVQMISKSLKVFVVCVGLLTTAQAFSLPIAGLVGGLGIGGMALALASKDAVSNLFGSFTVLVDRPFEVGDWIITNNTEGTVENVGFRSTRIRTFYNSLITLPNSLLTAAVVDNMGARRYRRVKTTLGLQYDTTPEQVDAFCEGVRELIRRHPYTRKDYYHVYFNGFGASSLDVLLYCFMECPDWAIELREKHRLFCDILRLAQRLGVQFAFPTQTLHFYQEDHAHDPVPPDLASPDQVGRREAAAVAGPLRTGTQRPGPVLFGGPSDVG